MSSPAPQWLKPAARFGLSGVTSAIGALGGLARNKLLATWLGTGGMGVWGQIVSAQLWLGTLTGAGLTIPLSHAIAIARGAGKDDVVRRATWTVGIAVAVAAVVVCGAGLALAPQLSTALLGTPRHALLVRLSMIGVAGIAAQVTLQGLWAGYADVRVTFTNAWIGNVVATSAILVLVPAYGIAGGVLGAACFYPAAMTGAMWIHRARYRSAFLPAPTPRFDASMFGRLLRFAGVALTMSLLDQGVLVATRAHYVRVYGTSANGVLQAALTIAVQAGAIFHAYLGGYAFGRISGLPDVAAIRDYTRRQWRPITAAAALLAAFVMLAATPLLHLLYSNRFDAARGLLAWTMLGEFCRVAMQVWLVGALTVGGLRLWAPVGLGYTATVAVGYVLATHRGAGPYSLPYAYAVAGFVGLLLAGAAMSRRGVTLAGRDFTLLALMVAALLSLALRLGH